MHFLLTVLDEALALNNELERKCLDLERRTRSGSSASTSRDKASVLHRKLDKLQGEHKRMKEVFQNTIRTKEQELNLMEKMCEEQKSAYESAVSQVRRLNSSTNNSSSEATSGALPSARSADLKKVIQELKLENNFLREQLADMKDRFDELVDGR